MAASLRELLGDLRPLTSLRGLIPGVVASFHYPLFKHDPYPVVLVLEDQGPYLFGLNLHYLSFPAIRDLFRRLGPVPNYQQIKNMSNITPAFRKYKKTAISQPRVQSLAETLHKMLVVRKYPEHEIHGAVEDVRRQRQAESPPGETTTV